MMRLATAKDEPQIEKFLRQYPETSMFLRGNIARHGVGQGDDNHSTDVFLWENTGGIDAVFGCTRGGYLMCQMPVLNAEASAAFVKAISGRQMRGITGHSDQVPHVVHALGLDKAVWSVERDEPLYRMSLDRLPKDAANTKLRGANPEDAALLEDWFVQYELDTGLSAVASHAKDRAKFAAQAAVSGDTLRLLEQDGSPVAMTNFNAVLPDSVQVGGVFVRRDLRRQGLGRRVVAAHLAEACSNGVKTASLFSANAKASQTYESIGFSRCGAYRINLLADSIRIGEAI